MNGRSRTLDDPELVGSLMSAVEQLRTAEDELARQNAELLSLSAALDGERRRYQQLFDRAPLAHLTTDTSGRIVEANEAAGRMLRVDPRFLPGKPIAAFVVSQDRRRFRTWLLHPSELEQPVFRMRRRANVTFDAEVHVFRDEETLSWLIRDVTDELHAERQLWDLNRDLERRVAEQAGEIATVYDQLPVGVVIVRPGRTPPRLNPRAHEILEGAYPFDAEVGRALAGEDVRGATVRFARDEGERVLEVTAAPLRGPRDEVTGAVVTFDDITERERIDRADRDFVTNASHQLRTPVTAVASAIAALQAGAADDPVERGRFVEHLQTETARLARIIDAMLVLSRAQRQELDAPLTLVRVGPLLERLAAGATPTDGVSMTCSCDETVAVIAHPGLLEEAIASGIANAVQHTEQGTITVGARDLGVWVAIEIADTGPGMPPEVRERAFERFFSSTPSRRSAGLGLAVAEAAVRASRGRIELESEPEVGTRLRILLRSAPLLGS